MLLSHPELDNLPAKTLVEHLGNVADKSVDTIKNNIIEPTIISKDELIRLSELIGVFHDIGKATTCFQSYIIGNRKACRLTSHSLVSSFIALFFTRKEFEDKWAYIVFQVILRHHSDLVSFRYDFYNKENDFKIVKDQIDNIIKYSLTCLKSFFSEYRIDIFELRNIDYQSLFNILEDTDELIYEIRKNNDEQAIELFFLVNYLFSILINCDKMDAARLDNSYFDGNMEEAPNDVFDYLTKCRQEDPDNFDPKIKINHIRNNFLSCIDNNININPNNHFYSITAPTGIGKTFGCLVFANRLQKRLGRTLRIIYALPYTSIIDQNYIEFEKIILHSKQEKYLKRPNRYLLKHHYLNPRIIHNRKDTEYSFLKDYLDDILLYESWQASVIVTTYVQLVQSILGYKNKLLKKFHNIVNSIIILDEVQNIDPNYHGIIGKSFEVLAKIFKIYILQVTATQPNIINNNRVIELADPDTFMKDKVFDRVAMKYYKNPTNLEEFFERFCSSFTEDNCLIVLNTRKDAISLYSMIHEEFNTDYECFCLTTYLTPYHRNKKIDQIKGLLKEKKKVIVISTQLVEAGVDISFKITYRDFAPLDSIIQVAGRCNRNGEYGQKGGAMNLFDFSRVRIYSGVLIQLTKEILQKNDYSSLDYYELSNFYFSKLHNLYDSTCRNILSAIKELNYDKKTENQIPISEIKLITDKIMTNLYILHTPEANKDMNDFFLLKSKAQESNSKEEAIVELEKIKYRLKPFQISLYPDEIIKYSQIIRPKNEYAEDKHFLYKYISYSDQANYAYDIDIGFLPIPKKQISSLEIF